MLGGSAQEPTNSGDRPMPVRKTNLQAMYADDPKYKELLQHLTTEWREEKWNGTGTAPEIEEQTDKKGRVLRLIVVWNDWADLEAQKRSEMIVDAFKAVRGEGAIADLSIAMGLTTAEAERLRKVGP